MAKAIFRDTYMINMDETETLYPCHSETDIKLLNYEDSYSQRRIN